MSRGTPWTKEGKERGGKGAVVARQNNKKLELVLPTGMGGDIVGKKKKGKLV